MTRLARHNSPWRVSMAALLTALIGSLAFDTARGADEPDPVTSGRKALAEWGAAPWYDARHDALQPIDLSAKPPKESSGQQSWLKLALQWAAWLLLGGLLAALAFLVFRSLWDGNPLGADPHKPVDPALAAERVEALPFMSERRQDDLLGEAQRHYEAGNYSEAIIYLFSYQLVELDKSSLIHLAKGKTNRQYLREAARVRPVARLLEGTTIAFEEVFFGRRSLDRAGFEACWSRLAEFENLVSEAVP